MKFSKKFSLILGLVAIFVSLFPSTAFAANTRIVRYAGVTKVRVLDDQPATFSLLGSYTCDRVQINASVSGKIISISAYDVKLEHTGVGCGESKAYQRIINLGTLVPGKYTVLINPDSAGKAQKKYSFIAPVLPATNP
jgi:hypothetical protein